MENDFKKVQEEINDKYKHAADTITDGFRCFFLGIHKGKDGGFGWYGKEKADKELNELYTLPALRLPDEKLQLKEQVSYLTDRNKALENKNAKLEGELSAYRQMLNILSKEHQDEN